MNFDFQSVDYIDNELKVQKWVPLGNKRAKENSSLKVFWGYIVSNNQVMVVSQSNIISLGQNNSQANCTTQPSKSTVAF